MGRSAAAGPGQPAWARAALAALLVAAGVLYLAGLSRNGWTNDFYAAAVQAGTNAETVDGVTVHNLAGQAASL